MSDLK